MSYKLQVAIVTVVKFLRSYGLTVFFLSPFSFLPLSAQQVQLKGVVTVQNSKTYTGKTQFVKNAEVTHPKAKPELTDDDGKFTLNITGEKPNSQIQISVFPYGEFADYVVVNEKELKDITLGRLTPVSVFVCKKGELEKRQAEMVGINMRKLEEKMEADKKRLQKELDAIRANNDYLNVRYSQIKDSLDIISKNIDNAFERIKEYAKTMTLENLDDRDENYVKAYDCFSRGALDSVSYYLQEQDLDLKYQKIVQLQQEAKKEKELAAVLTESAKAKDEYTENSMNELIKEWLLLARTADMQNDYEKAMNLYEKVVHADPLHAELIIEYANYLQKIIEYNKAEEYYLQGLEIYKNAAQNTNNLSKISSVLNNFGSLQYLQKDFDSAMQKYEESLKISKVLAAENPNEYLYLVTKTLNNIGVLHFENKNYTEALKNYEEVLEISRHLEKENFKEDLVNALVNIANYYKEVYEFLKALPFYEEALEISKNLAAKNPKKYLELVAKILNNQSALYRDISEFSDAKKCINESLDIYRELTADNPKVYKRFLANALNDLGGLYHFLREYDNALSAFEEALIIRKELAATNPKAFLLNLANAIFNKALLKTDMGISETLPEYEESLKIYRELAVENPNAYLESVAKNLRGMGIMYFYNKNYNYSIEKYQESLDIYRELYLLYPATYLFDVGIGLHYLAHSHMLNGDYSEALLEFEEALDIFTKLAESNHKSYYFFVAITLSDIATSFTQLKKYPDAKKKYEESLKLFEEIIEDNPNEFYINYLANVCMDFAGYFVFIKDYYQAELYVRKAIENEYIDSRAMIRAKHVLAHTLLYQNRFSEAETVFIELSQIIYENGESEIETILKDFDTFEKEELIPEERKADVEKIREMLKKARIEGLKD